MATKRKHKQDPSRLLLFPRTSSSVIHQEERKAEEGSHGRSHPHYDCHHHRHRLLQWKFFFGFHLSRRTWRKRTRVRVVVVVVARERCSSTTTIACCCCGHPYFLASLSSRSFGLFPIAVFLFHLLLLRCGLHLFGGSPPPPSRRVPLSYPTRDQLVS